jgi:hypothetical protein
MIGLLMSPDLIFVKETGIFSASSGVVTCSSLMILLVADPDFLASEVFLVMEPSEDQTEDKTDHEIDTYYQESTSRTDLLTKLLIEQRDAISYTEEHEHEHEEETSVDQGVVAGEAKNAMKQ